MYSETGRIQAFTLLQHYGDVLDIKSYFASRGSSYSVLLDMYKKYACIPSSSASVERSFSIQGLVQTTIRNRLSASTIANILIVRANLSFIKNTSLYSKYLSWIHNADGLGEKSKWKFYFNKKVYYTCLFRE